MGGTVVAELRPETYAAAAEGMRRSASIVLPMVFDHLGGVPEALIDVGAGEGWWTLEARELGVASACGMDAMHSDLVHYWDAERGDPLPLHGKVRSVRYEGDEMHVESDPLTRWPLALCLEMAEHVTPTAGDHLVAELCRVADAIVFSAATPGQGGDGHVNEAWASDYWHPRFAAHGYWLHDPGWRMQLMADPRCEPWYAANALLAVPGFGPPPVDLVHAVTWAYHRGVPAPNVV